MNTNSPSKMYTSSSYIGDRYIPYRNTEKWDINFNINDNNENRSPLIRRTRDGSFQTGLTNANVGGGGLAGIGLGGNVIGTGLGGANANTGSGLNGAMNTPHNANTNVNNRGGNANEASLNNNNNTPVGNNGNNNMGGGNVNAGGNGNMNTNGANAAGANGNTAPNNQAGGNNNVPIAGGGAAGTSGGSNSSNLESNKDITMYRAVLKNELLGTTIDGIGNHSHYQHAAHGHNNNNANNNQQGGVNGGNNSNVNNNQINSLSNSTTFSVGNGLNHTSRLMSALQPREMTSVFQV